MQMFTEERHGVATGESFFDFGRSAYGTLEVELTADFDHLVEVVIGESCSNGSILHEHSWRTFIIDRIVARKGTHTYKFNIPKFYPAYGSVFPYTPTPAEYGGEVAPFRYVEVNHYYGPLKVRRTVCQQDWDDSASVFESSDPQLDQVWDFCKYSIKATNVFGYYIDGDRERQPYEGDTYINQLGHFCCDANFETARRTMDWFAERPTWPTEWQLLSPILAEDYLLYSGDRASVDRWLKWLPERLLDNLEVRDGMITGQGRIRDIIDWPEPDRDGYVFGEVNFVPNAYRVGALRAMFNLTGDKKYLERAEALKQVMRKTMWQGELPEDSPNAGHTSLHTAVFAVRFGIAEESEKAALGKFIRSRGMQCSVYGAQYLLEVCGACGMDDYLLELLTGTGTRSWLHMLAAGSTITMEGWDNLIKPHQDWTHAWGAAPANLIPRWVVGLRPTKPGFADYILDPHPGDLEYFHFRQPTPDGCIDVYYEDGKASVERTVF